MQGELKSLQRDVGITFIYVTHDQEEAMDLSDVIVVMEQGASRRSARPRRSIALPPTATSPISSGETNLLEGVVTEMGAGGVRGACGS